MQSCDNSLIPLVDVIEELLFSFALPPEVVKKYESMKDLAFRQAGLNYTPSPYGSYSV
jgi:hypothetical protein